MGTEITAKKKSRKSRVAKDKAAKKEEIASKRTPADKQFLEEYGKRMAAQATIVNINFIYTLKA